MHNDNVIVAVNAMHRQKWHTCTARRHAKAREETVPTHRAEKGANEKELHGTGAADAGAVGTEAAAMLVYGPWWQKHAYNTTISQQ